MIYTLANNHSFTLIDNIFTNASDYDNTSGLLISDVSDHLPVFVICKYPNLNRKTKKQLVKKHLVNSDTLDSLNDKLLDENWETVLSSKDVNNAYKYFLVKFTEIYNRCCPVKMVRNSTSNRDKPWITKGLTNACRKKNTLYKKILRSRTVISETKYKLYKNKLTSILRFSEKSYYSKRLTFVGKQRER